MTVTPEKTDTPADFLPVYRAVNQVIAGTQVDVALRALSACAAEAIYATIRPDMRPQILRKFDEMTRVGVRALIDAETKAPSK